MKSYLNYLILSRGPKHATTKDSSRLLLCISLQISKPNYLLIAIKHKINYINKNLNRKSKARANWWPNYLPKFVVHLIRKWNIESPEAARSVSQELRDDCSGTASNQPTSGTETWIGKYFRLQIFTGSCMSKDVEKLCLLYHRNLILYSYILISDYQ